MRIKCLNCGGRGYVVSTGYNGTKTPYTCKACNGTGVQVVRP